MGSSRYRNRSGVAWSAIERFGIQGSQFVVTMILARTLLPADYGIIAMLTIFFALSTALIDSGMSQALIQRQSRSEADLTTALIFNIGVALSIYALLYLCAPLIADFYNTPQLCSVARVYLLILVINSFGVVQQALITIELNFRRQAAASFVGILCGACTALVMAHRGYGVWSLVAQQIVSDTIRTALLWALSSWRPTAGFSMESLRELSRFGTKVMASGLMHVLYVNLYPLIIGRHFAPSQLGLFNRATTIGALPSSNISTIVDRALYPILCAKQSDCHAAASTLHRYLGGVCFFVFPAMVGLAVLARPTVSVLLGERWMGVVPLLQIIAIAYMWDPVMKFMGSIIKSQGRPDHFLRAEIAKKITGLAILFSTIPLGIEAMAYGLILYAACDMAIVIFFARRSSTELGYRAVAGVVAPTAAISAAMGGAMWYALGQLEGVAEWLQLIAVGGLGAVLYTLLAFATRRPEARELLSTIKRTYTK
ncbi:MAG: lipopolysaccharide biosynthesis protein [Rikenellaceae bacterium]